MHFRHILFCCCAALVGLVYSEGSAHSDDTNVSLETLNDAQEETVEPTQVTHATVKLAIEKATTNVATAENKVDATSNKRLKSRNGDGNTPKAKALRSGTTLSSSMLHETKEPTDVSHSALDSEPYGTEVATLLAPSPGFFIANLYQNVEAQYVEPTLPSNVYNLINQCKFLNTNKVLEKAIPETSILGKLNLKSYPSTNVMKNWVSILNDPEFYQNAGRYSIAQRVYEIYSALRIYKHQEWLLNAMYLDRQPGMDLFQRFLVNLAYMMVETENSLSKSICQSFDNLELPPFCEATEYWLTVNCMDNYAMRVNTDSMCEKLTAPNMGITIPTKCQHIFENQSHLDLQLTEYHGNSFFTPVYILPSIIHREKYKYYLMLKAIQRFSRWADLHRFCINRVDDFGEKYEKLELVPGWELQYYWYTYDSLKGISPLAAFAKYRSKRDKHTDTTARFLLVIRDAKTTTEAFTRIMTRSKNEFVADRNSLKFSIHEGYVDTANAMNPEDLLWYLKKEAMELKEECNLYFTVVAAGQYGTGIAFSLLHSLVRDLSPNYKGPLKIMGCTLRNTLVSFSSAYTGDMASVLLLSETTVFRHIVDHSEPLDYTSCASPFSCQNKPHDTVDLRYDATPKKVHLLGRVELNSVFPKPTSDATKNRFEPLVKDACATTHWLEEHLCSTVKTQSTLPGCGVSYGWYSVLDP